MPNILITGNGFDLHHSLPTSYSDFINITRHISLNKSFEFTDIYKNANNYYAIHENFHSFIFDENKIIKYSELANKNLLYNFFQDELELDTWIDFENKIELILNSIISGIKLIRENYFSKSEFPINYLGEINYKTLNNDILIFDILKYFKITKIDYSESTLYEQLLVKRGDFYIDIDEEKIAGMIYSQLMEFKKLFNDYLLLFVNPLLNQNNSKDLSLSFLKNVDYHFTFNYTETFNKLKYNENIKTQFLHGKCSENEENIIFGINEIPIDSSKYFNYIKFTKYYQKLNGNTDYYFLNNIKPYVHEKFTFIFWGHSLDYSDASYINEVFDFITKNDVSEKRIIIIHHNESSRSRMLLNLLKIRGRDDIESKMKSKILLFELLDSDKIKKMGNIASALLL